MTDPFPIWERTAALLAKSERILAESKRIRKAVMADGLRQGLNIHRNPLTARRVLVLTRERMKP